PRRPVRDPRQGAARRNERLRQYAQESHRRAGVVRDGLQPRRADSAQRPGGDRRGVQAQGRRGLKIRMTEIDAVHRSQRHTLPMALGALLATLVALMSSVSARAQAPAPGNAPPPAPEVGLALESRFEEFMRILNGDFARLQSDLFSAGFRETMPIGEFGETLKK